jgi:hypothetical protein
MNAGAPGTDAGQPCLESAGMARLSFDQSRVRVPKKVWSLQMMGEVTYLFGLNFLSVTASQVQSIFLLKQ